MKLAFLLCVFFFFFEASSFTSPRLSLRMKIFDWKRREQFERLEFDEEFSCPTLGNLQSIPGSRKRFKRVGRGISAGQGRACGRGMRGQRSRSGAGIRPTFEGGQTPLFRRMPKYPRRTQNYHRRDKYHLVKLQDLHGANQTYLTPRVLFDLGLLGKYREKPVIYKIVGNSPNQFSNKTIEAYAFTKPARNFIESSGGTCILLSKTRHIPITNTTSFRLSSHNVTAPSHT